VERLQGVVGVRLGAFHLDKVRGFETLLICRPHRQVILEITKIVQAPIFGNLNQKLIMFSDVAWRSGHRIRLRNKHARVQIPPGYKVFRET
jgi:hypothetical protein